MESYNDIECINLKEIMIAWEELNPYNKRTQETHSKSLIDLLDDLFIQRIDKHPDIMPPSIEVAKENNFVNRWNPPDKRYLYLTRSKDNPLIDGITENEYTCL